MMWSPASASSRRQAGQTVYVVMLALACIFLAIAIAFPTCEFILNRYWEEPRVTGARPAAPSPSRPAPAPAEPSGPTGPAAPAEGGAGG